MWPVNLRPAGCPRAQKTLPAPPLALDGPAQAALSVSPTKAGERLYLTAGPRFADIEAELALLAELRGKPVGAVRITATEHAVRTLPWPRLAPWLPKYPDIKAEISSNNRFIDIVAERFDVGLRLPSHSGLLAWAFKQGGKGIHAQVTGRLVFDASDMVVASALGGHGLALAPEDAVVAHIAAGRLVSVRDDWSQTFPGHHASHPLRWVWLSRPCVKRRRVESTGSSPTPVRPAPAAGAGDVALAGFVVSLQGHDRPAPRCRDTPAR